MRRLAVIAPLLAALVAAPAYGQRAEPVTDSKAAYTEAQNLIREAVEDEWITLDLSRLHGLAELPPEIAALTELVALNLGETGVNDLSLIAGMTEMTDLALYGTRVMDLSPLAGMKNLEWLHLNDTPVVDLSPLSNLSKLVGIDLTNTAVTDLSPLSGIEGLEIIR